MRIHYLSSAMPSPTPLLLLPGTLCDSRQWAPVGARLEPRPILVGDLTLDDSVEAMAERVLRTAPPRFRLAGFSMGGIVALEVERRARGRVTGLALVSSNARPDSQLDRGPTITRARDGYFKEIVLDMAQRALHQTADPALLQTVMVMAADLGVEVFARQNLALASRRDSRADLGDISVPTLILCGDDDQVSPFALSREMAKTIPGAILQTLPQCGHMAPLEQPRRVAAALSAWLADPA
jgi:pimeloyl-ACP methyl ester carboxylesterase